MKIRDRLAVVMILCMLIPLTMTAAFDSIYLDKYEHYLCIQRNRSYSQAAANAVSTVFSDIFNSMSALASSRTIKNYADTVLSGAPEDYSGQDISELLGVFSGVYSPLDVQIIDNDGVVKASTKKELVDTLSNIYTAGCDTENGISYLFVYRSGNAKNAAFSVRRLIYNSDNDAVGMICAVYSYNTLRKTVDNVASEDYIKYIITDGAGNMVRFPYDSVRDAVSDAEYKIYGSTLSVGDHDAGYDYTYELKPRNAVIADATHGWKVISIADLYEFGKTKKSNVLRTILFAVVFSALIIVFVNMHLIPISEIAEFLDKKRKGNVLLHLPENAPGEIGAIYRNFNDLFDKLAGSELRYRKIAEMTDNIVFEINFRKKTVTMSNSFNKKFSFRPENESIEESFLYKWRPHKNDSVRFREDIDNILTNGEKLEGEYRFKDMYGEFCWVKIKAEKLRDRENNPYAIVGVIVDIDKEKRSEMHLIQQATYDNLTQLYNRETFIKMLSDDIDISVKRNSLAAVMFIDLDNFKFFNDHYGHACGDEVLKFTAETIKEITFEHGFGGRFGGDEFVVYLNSCKLIEDVGRCAGKIIEILGSGFISASTGQKLTISCSIGIAFYGDNGTSSAELIAAADRAMYKIKKSGKSAYAYARADDPQVSEIENTATPIDPTETGNNGNTGV